MLCHLLSFSKLLEKFESGALDPSFFVHLHLCCDVFCHFCFNLVICNWLLRSIRLSTGSGERNFSLDCRIYTLKYSPGELKEKNQTGNSFHFLFPVHDRQTDSRLDDLILNNACTAPHFQLNSGGNIAKDRAERMDESAEKKRRQR